MAKLKKGQKAPDFEKPWTGEGNFRLSDRKGKWTVLAFYPGDETTTCTRQMCDYRDNGDKLDQLDADVIGISPQGVDSHESFIANHDLNVPLVADEGLEVAEAYGIRLGSALRRAIFIVDPDLNIAHADVKLVGLTFTDADGIAKALSEAKAAA